MDSAVTIIYKFSSTQINNSKVIWISVRILVKAEAETEYIIEALFEAAMVSNGFFIFSNDGVFTFETRSNQIFLYKDVNIT